MVCRRVVLIEETLVVLIEVWRFAYLFLRFTLQHFVSGVGRGEGVLDKVLYGDCPPRGPNPYPSMYHFFQKGTPLLNIPRIKRSHPFFCPATCCSQKRDKRSVLGNNLMLNGSAVRSFQKPTDSFPHLFQYLNS